MSLSEIRPGLWGWSNDPSAANADAAHAAAAEIASTTAELVVVDGEPGTVPRLGAHLFVTNAGRARFGVGEDHLGSLAGLDYWFRVHEDGAAIQHVLHGEPSRESVAADPAAGSSAIEITELVHRHLGYLPVQWATVAAVIDGRHSAVDFLQAYNYSSVAQDRMRSRSDLQAVDTLEVVQRLGLQAATHCRRTATREEIVLEDSVPRKVGPQFWAFDRPWYREQRTKWHGLIERELRDDRPFVIAGNGPSLRASLPDISATEPNIRLVTSNFAVLEPALHAHTHLHTVVNYMVAEQAAGLINLLPERVAIVVPFWLSYCIQPRPNVFFTETTADLRFSDNIAKEVSWVHTVSFYAMQLAAGLSTLDAALVGFDHSYTQPVDIEEGEQVVESGPDVNHFRSDYFSGKRWQAADTDMMETVYRLAAESFSGSGRAVVNCTVGGELEVFPRSTLLDFAADR